MDSLQINPVLGLQQEKELNCQLRAENTRLLGENRQLQLLNLGLTAPDAGTEVEFARDRLNNFFMQAPAGIAILGGSDFIFELVNSRYQHVFPDRILLGKAAIVAFPELEGTAIWDVIRKVYETGVSFEGREVLIPLARTAGGIPEDRFFNVIYQARRNKLQQIDGMLIFSFEVTDMVLVKRQLQQSERRFRVILDALPQIAWTSTISGEISFVNQRWYDFTGLDFEQNRDNLWALTIHADDLPSALETVSTIMREVRSGELEFRKLRKDGVYRWHLCRMQPVLNEEGTLLFWIGTATDIEDLKWLQQQKDDFVNIASHELKTPLTSLQISIQLLAERISFLSPTLVNTLIQRASKNMDKVTGLVEDLFNAGKLSQNQLELNKTWFLPVVLLEDFCHELQQAGRYTIEFSGRTDLMLYADAKRIEQVFINILNNAIKYAPESRMISIHISNTSERIQVSIIDQGPGIPAELIPHLFDRYYHVEHHGFQKTGLGLGLYICAEILHRHAGTIWVNSEPGMGSTFSFDLPLLS